MCVPSFAHRQRALPATPVINNKELLLAKSPLTCGSSLASLFYSTEHHHPSSKQQEKQQHNQIVVQHDYHDRSNDIGNYNMEVIPTTRGGVGVPFPVRLHEMLQRVQDEGLEFIVSWQPHGRCFVVHDPKGFVEVILPKYFKQSKLASFQRQLNLYGFQRLTTGKDKGGYYNEYFLRGRVDLCSSIHRVKVKGTKVRAKSNPDAEPNLWMMSWITSDGKAALPRLQQQQHHQVVQRLSPVTKLPSTTAVLSEATILSALECTVLPAPVKCFEEAEEDDYDLFFFEGKAFHAVESSEKQQQQQLQQPNHHNHNKQPVSSMTFDDFTDEDAESLLGDIDLPSSFHLDIIGAIDDDIAFGNLLERLIDEQ